MLFAIFITFPALLFRPELLNLSDIRAISRLRPTDPTLPVGSVVCPVAYFQRRRLSNERRPKFDNGNRIPTIAFTHTLHRGKEKTATIINSDDGPFNFMLPRIPTIEYDKSFDPCSRFNNINRGGRSTEWFNNSTIHRFCQRKYLILMPIFVYSRILIFSF